jgi:hypothetical protein
MKTPFHYNEMCEITLRHISHITYKEMIDYDLLKW